MDRALAAVADSAESVFNNLESSADRAGRGMGDSVESGSRTAERALEAMGEAAVSAARAAESAELKLAATRTRTARDVRAAEEAVQAARSGGDVSAVLAAEERLGEARARATSSVIDAEDRLAAARRRAANAADTGSLGDTTGGLDDLAGGLAEADTQGSRFGGTMKDMVGKAAGLAAGLAGVAGAVALIADAYAVTNEIATMNAQLGLTGETAEAMGAEVRGAMRGGVAAGVEDATSAIGSLNSQFKYLGSEGEQTALDLSDNFIGFARTFDLEMSEATQTAGQLIKHGLATDVEDAADLMTTAMQRVPAAMRGELPEIINEYGTNFASLGFSGAEAFDMLIAASDGGTIALDKTGDALKEFGIRATDLGDTGAVEALAALGLAGEDVQARLLAGGDTARGAFTQVTDALVGVTDPAKQAEMAIALFGTPLEDLDKTKLPAFLESLNATGEGMIGFEGSSQALADSISGSLEGRINTLKGTVSSLAAEGFMIAWDAIENYVLPAISGLVDGVSSAVTWVTDSEVAMSLLAAAVTAVAVALIPMIARMAFAGVAAIVSGIATAFTALRTAVLAVNAAMRANVFGIIVTAIAAVVAGLAYFFTQTETGQRIWETLMGALRTAGEWLSSTFTSVWGKISDAASSAFQWISDAWSTVWGALQSVWDSVGQPIIDLIVGAFNIWWTVVSTYFKLVGAVFQVLWTGMQMAWESIGKPIIDGILVGFQWLSDGVGTVFGWMQSAWAMLLSGLQVAWATVGQPVVDFIVGAFQMWWDGMQILFGYVQAGWAFLWSGIVAVYDTVIAPVVQWIRDRFNDLQAGIGIALDFIRNAIQGAADKVSAFYSSHVQPMVDSVIRGFNRVVETVTGWKDTIVGALTGAGSWLVETGKNIVQGLIDGIKSLAGTIGSAFLNMIPGWIQEPFKVALGIESPSKVFAGFGRNIGEGLIEGISSMQTGIEGALGGATETALAVGDEMHAALSGGDNGYAALGTVIGDTAAQGAYSLAAGAGETTRTVGASAEEFGAAATGADMGYGATADLFGEDAALAALDVSETIGGAFAAAGTGIEAARAGIIDPAVAGMSANLTGLGTNALTQAGAITSAMNAAGLGLTTAKTTVIDPALAAMQANLTQTGLTTQAAMLGTALPAVQQTGFGIQAVQNTAVAPALAGMQGSINNTAGAFATGTGAINAEFNKVREGVAAPSRYAIGPVFNEGLVGMWNSVAGMVGLDEIGKHPINFHSGGIMPGYTPGRDPFHFVDPKAGISLGLSGGESIMRPEWTRAIGPDRVHAMNAAARYGGVSGVERILAQEHQPGTAAAYANGGIMHLGNFANGAILDSMTGFVNRFFPQLSLTSGWRFTDNGYHSRGMAGDFSNQGTGGPPTPASIGLANAIYKNFKDQTAELIHWPLSGWNNVNNGNDFMYNSGTNAQHTDHVHWALPTPLLPSGADLDFSTSGAAVNVDPKQIIESMMGSRATETKDRANAFKGAGGTFDKVPSALHGTLVGPIMDTLVKAFEAFGGDPGGGEVERWRPLAMQALSRMGYNPEQYIDAMMQQIVYESSGDPNSINLWDSNALAGYPSGGLLHVIEPTYRTVRGKYPDAFAGLPDDRMHPLTNLTAGVAAVTNSWGGPGNRWPTRAGYDMGGIAEGIGMMPKWTLEPERVLSPRQTEAFEGWLAAGARLEDINALVSALTWREDPANLPVVQPERLLTDDQESVITKWRDQGQQIDSIQGLVDSMHGLQIDQPEVMGREINRRFRAWLGDAPTDNAGDVRHLVAALEEIEWERVTSGMQKSAEAWANGQWVQVGEGKRLATPDEMGQQVGDNMLAEIADEFGGMIGLKGLYKPRNIVGESGIVDLVLPEEVTDAQIVPSAAGAGTVAAAGATPTAVVAAGTGGAQNIEVTVNIDVSGVQDPKAVSDLVLAEVGRGVEQAIGGTVRST